MANDLGHAHAHEDPEPTHEHAHSSPRLPGSLAMACEAGLAAASSVFTASEARQARRLGLVIVLVAGFFLLEFAGALVAESVVLQAEALHLLTDILALGASLMAMRLAVRRPTARFTFGLRRAEPVAAIVSAALVLATTAGIVVEAARALHEREPPRAGIMLVIATAALVVNGVSAWLLHDALGHAHGHAADPDNPDDPGTRDDDGHDAHGHAHGRADGHALNLRGAILHLAGDTMGAMAAITAALCIRYGGASLAWTDPVASLVVAVILVIGSIRLLRDATMVLLEAAPPHLSVAAIRAVIDGFPEVEGVHDLHVWTLGAGHDAVTAHVRTSSRDAAFAARLASRLRAVLRVEYVTVQAEPHADREREPEEGEPAPRSRQRDA